MPRNIIEVRNVSGGFSQPRGESAARQRRWQACVDRLTALIADHFLTRLHARAQAAALTAPLSRQPVRTRQSSTSGRDDSCGPA